MRVVNTLLIVIILSLAPLSLHAQSSKDNQAKAYYFVALEAFEAKQYDEVLASIKNVEDLLGSSNARLSALKVKTYFEQNKLDKAKAELDTFFSYQSSDEQGREMASYLRKIESAKAQIEKEKEAEAAKLLKLKAEKEAEIARLVKTLGMVTIPAGSFMMGSNYDTYYFGIQDTKPVHQVNINTFKLMEGEVTFAQWDACISAGGCWHKPDDEGWGRGNRPVIKVSYNDITQQFIPWLNKLTGQTYRLPSEAEWEYAARAGSTTKYSWGDSINCSLARYGQSSYKDGGECGKGGKTVPVKSYQANAFGLYDMHGNVGEWIQDCWNENYNGAPSNGQAWTSGDCAKRVKRGGSWAMDSNYQRSAGRDYISLKTRLWGLGFRLAQDIQ
ncbi:SUMF1/EgtB/PvdO family nonheme iron enzyme [Rheinheimera baltica]|uniref:SUMF1/EgtB/PvdO family nonheme iron enzyme n=1 Tax=Rheinheimera baltica TaxID=67576 RepID=UPI00040BC03E|nr:SUMF1/EgtB/PvdO family nonheme iron enzyme [Rheinheimera baltica]